MGEIKGVKNPQADIASLGFNPTNTQFWNLSAEELTKIAVEKGMGQIASSGALAVDTGEFTGRSPKDRFVVKDSNTEDSVDWGNVNIPFEPSKFDQLWDKVVDYLNDKELYIRDAQAGADKDYRLPLRVITELPWSNQFANNMFLRPTEEEIQSFEPEWHVIQAPGFKAVPEVDGTRQHNFAIINFTKKCILIGGTGYTGEIKKGIFSVLNYLLPHKHKVLSMHCSANIGQDGDTALFFGLSGTGKTTLSADPDRGLIGDDEHGWTDKGVFNFEGGCYAKVIDLSEEKEPQIFNAIKPGAILENIVFKNGNEVDFHDTTKTENTRVSYPIYHIDNAVNPSMGGHPKNIFFLTYDAFGVLPPISKLNPGQAMYHFISGFTSKVAGTEEGVTEPQMAFSACFGSPFLPLHPTKYAELLGKKMREHNVNVWLVNTGLVGGPYGVGERMSLKHTRALISAALNGELDGIAYHTHPVFGVQIPESCPNVPSEVLNPKNTWEDKDSYDAKANELARAFSKNFKRFEEACAEEILQAAPKVVEKV